MVIMLCFHSFPVHSLSLPFHSKSINQSNSQWNPPLSSTNYLLSLPLPLLHKSASLFPASSSLPSLPFSSLYQTSIPPSLPFRPN